MSSAITLVSTVGTSLLGNLKRMATSPADPVRALVAEAFAKGDDEAAGRALARLDAAERDCGAEVNSCAALFAQGKVQPRARLAFCHSATEDGRRVARILQAFFAAQGSHEIACEEIAGLQDQDRQAFRLQGLRNLARVICRIVRTYGAEQCAINATGGYKAQIAVAVMLGQALSTPVYYLHESFQGEIIAFPPLPVALDFGLWLRHSDVLFSLDREQMLPAAQFEGAFDEKLECLLERENVDAVEVVTLSATGQIFLETFRERFRLSRDKLLPPAVPSPDKKPPRCDHGHLTALPALENFLVRLTREVPQVRRCETFYHHPSLARQTLFRLGSQGPEGIYSDGRQTVKFRVETSAENSSQLEAMVALLNESLAR